MESYPHKEKTRPTSEYEAHGHSHHSKPSNSDLLSSAKVVADAVRHRGEKDFDSAKVASAAANILHAASEYGKLDDKPIGKMVGKAEDYLHQYQISHSTTTTTTNPGMGGGHSSTATTTTTTTTTSSGTTHSSNLPGKDHSGGGGSGGYGDYIKMAEGLFNKNSGSGHGSGGETAHSSEDPSGGGGKYGDYIKMAEGVFNKFSGDHSSTGGTAHSGGQHGHSESGYGEYMKMAGDFLKKH